VRGLAAILPEIEVVADCPFSCDPDRPDEQCAGCRARNGSLTRARRRRRIVDLPLNATEDRVAGSVDVGRALRDGVRALEPGLLAEANRGILYVDEVNLLDDHVADVLLDAAALGVNVVEREGVSVEHPARFLLVGTMNPEEGELRPQLADRFGLHVVVEALLDVRGRADVMRRRESFTRDAGAFASEWAEEEQALSARVATAQERLPEVHVPDALYRGIARLVVRMGVVSHRADVTILECAKALAALDARGTATADDVADAAALALGHRLPRDPFGPPAEVDLRQLRRVVEDVVETEVDERKAPGPAPR
jgi:Mg-chelatase subunit ChlI